MRAHACMAIVEGARGLFWWSVGVGALQDAPEPSRTEHLDALKTLVGELADLEDVLLADAAPSALAGNSNPAVETLVKVVGGRGYVFAYNSTGAPAATTFTWSATPGAVRVNAESRTPTGPAPPKGKRAGGAIEAATIAATGWREAGEPAPASRIRHGGASGSAGGSDA